MCNKIRKIPINIKNQRQNCINLLLFIQIKVKKMPLKQLNTIKMLINKFNRKINKKLVEVFNLVAIII